MSPWSTTQAYGLASFPVPEEAGAHVVLLGGDPVLMSTSTAGRSRALFEQRGLRVVAVDISEFEKLERA